MLKDTCTFGKYRAVISSIISGSYMDHIIMYSFVLYKSTFYFLGRYGQT